MSELIKGDRVIYIPISDILATTDEYIVIKEQRPAQSMVVTNLDPETGDVTFDMEAE